MTIRIEYDPDFDTFVRNTLDAAYKEYICDHTDPAKDRYRPQFEDNLHRLPIRYGQKWKPFKRMFHRPLLMLYEDYMERNLPKKPMPEIADEPPSKLPPSALMAAGPVIGHRKIAFDEENEAVSHRSFC